MPKSPPSSEFVNNGFISEVNVKKDKLAFTLKRKNKNKSIITIDNTDIEFTNKEVGDLIRNLQLYHARVIRREGFGMIDNEYL